MFVRKFLVAFFVGAWAALPTAALAASIVGLGHLPLRNPVSTANAISADGSVVVGVSFADATRFVHFEAFRWEASTGMVGLGTPEVAPRDTPFSEAYAVSGDGSRIVGLVGISPSRGGVWRITEGTIEPEAVPGLGSGDLPYGISADGTIIVGNGSEGAFRLETTTGTRTLLGALPDGSTAIQVTAVSGDGEVVVGSALSPLGYQAVRWDRSGGWQAIVSPLSGARTVSANGSFVAGGISGRAFRWDAAQGSIILGRVSDSDLWSNAAGISADGSIVVGYYGNMAGIEHALLWDAAGGAHPLEDLLSGLGVDLSEWSLLERATAVSDDGSRIVGYGINADGDREAWLAVIPEPGSGLLIGIGLAVLAASGSNGPRPARPVDDRALRSSSGSPAPRP